MGKIIEPLRLRLQLLSYTCYELNNNLTALNDGGNIEDFHIGEDGKAYITYKVGADTVTKKLGSGNFEKITVLAKKATYGSTASIAYTFTQDYDLVIASSNSYNPHDSVSRPNATIFTDVPHRLIIDNEWDGYKRGQACAVGILMDVKAGNTVTVSGSVTGACIIFAIN